MPLLDAVILWIFPADALTTVPLVEFALLTILAFVGLPKTVFDVNVPETACVEEAATPQRTQAGATAVLRKRGRVHIGERASSYFTGWNNCATLDSLADVAESACD